ncbi:MAG TPA: hypothetical protein VI215_02645 [Bacteroidota bacterium]
MISPKSQYRYYLSLDKTVKFAAAFYVTLLMGGTSLVWLGIGRVARDIHTGHLTVPLMFGGSLLLAFGGLLYGVGRINWISDMHAWLDRHFFRLLDKSNLVLFSGLSAALGPEEMMKVSYLEPEDKETLTNAVFNGLAGINAMFTGLLRTGILRLWIWYWIAMYGTFVFTILTVETFALALRGIDPYANISFAICWGLALAHFAAGLMLGSYLLRMMEDVARLLVGTQRHEIAALLRKYLGGGI